MAALGRLIQFDDRSRSFAAAEVLPEATRTKTWRLDVRNDQGTEGACVGFGIGHRLAADPRRRTKIHDSFSFGLYHLAKTMDPWEGEDYDGTSVLAGVKAAQQLGFVGEYRWCFSLEDIVRAVSNEGPVVVGTWWKDSMWRPQADGYMNCSGGNVGGHCYLLRGVDVKRERFTITNSWGRDWGRNGDAYIRFADYARYLMPEGEAVVVTET